MAVKQASIGPKGQWVLTEKNPVINVTCTRYTDKTNNSDKYRWFFTVTSSNPRNQPVWFTQTGRWTASHSESAYYHTLNNSGVVKFGGVISANSWNRVQQDAGRLHDALVDQKLNGYKKMPRTIAVNQTQTLSALLTRVGQTYTPGAPTTPTVTASQSWVPTPAPAPPAPYTPTGTPATPRIPSAPASDPAGSARAAIVNLEGLTAISVAQARVQLCEQALIEKKIDHFDGLSVAADARKSIAALKTQLSALEVSTNKLYATALEQGF